MCKYYTVRLLGMARQNNGAPRKVFGLKRGELIGEWRRYITRSFILCTHQFLIRSRRMKLAVHEARTRDRKHAYRVLLWRPEGKSHLEDLGVDGRVIL